MKRLLRTLVAVAALAGSAAACTNPLDPAAATVAGEEISRSEFQAEVKLIARALAEDQDEPFDANRIDQTIATNWMSYRVASKLIDQGAARYDLTASTDDLATAEGEDVVRLFIGRDDARAAANRERMGRVIALDSYLRNAVDAGSPWWSDDDVVSVARLIGVLSPRQALGDLDDAGRTRVEDTLKEVTSLGDWIALESRARGVRVDPRYGSWDSAQATVIPPPGPLQPGGDFDLSTLFGGG